MKKTFILLPVLLAIALVFCGCSGNYMDNDSGMYVPNITIDSETVSQKNYDYEKVTENDFTSTATATQSYFS